MTREILADAAAGAAGAAADDAGDAQASTRLQAVFARALAQWSGAPEVAFDLVTRAVSGPPLDLSRTAGCLLRTTPVRLAVTPDDDIDALSTRLAARAMDTPVASAPAAVALRVARTLCARLAATRQMGQLLEEVDGEPALLASRHALVVEVADEAGRLRLRCTYDAGRVAPESVDALLSACAAQAGASVAGARTAVSATPPAFELAGLPQDELSALLGDLAGELGAEDDADERASAAQVPAWK
jgi:hypothetical protein